MLLDAPYGDAILNITTIKDQPMDLFGPSVMKTAITAMPILIPTFSFTQAMLSCRWPHPQVPIVTVPHGNHVTHKTIFWRCFQKQVIHLGEWSHGWPPLEARVAQRAHIFSVEGFGMPCTKGLGWLFQARAHYSLKTYCPVGSHGHRSPASVTFGPPPIDWHNPETAHLYQCRLGGITMTRKSSQKPAPKNLPTAPDQAEVCSSSL